MILSQTNLEVCNCGSCSQFASYIRELNLKQTLPCNSAIRINNAYRIHVQHGFQRKHCKQIQKVHFCDGMNLPKESFFTSLILLSQFDFFAKRILLSQSIYRLANLIRLSHFLASLIRLSHFLANLILLSQPFLANRIRLSHGLLFLTNLILLSQTPLLSISSSSSEKEKKII